MPTRARARNRNHKTPRHEPALLDLESRRTTCKEVDRGLPLEAAAGEALRCLDCAHPACVAACPVHTDIPGFLAYLAESDVEGAFEKVLATNPFPGICGRVCQHELFCEKACVLSKKFEPVAIGSLERFVADRATEHAASKPAGTGGRSRLRAADRPR
jgi:glutamate synthase (NADPH/NADH) small chain